MAFDVSTAQPVKPTKFDVSTARPLEPDFAGAGIIEPIQAVASNIGRSVAGGLAGTAQALNPFAEEGAGARTVEEFQKGAFQPATQAGQAGMQTLGDLIKKGVDIANYPISGIAGLGELIAGQGVDQAVETIKSTQAQGLGKTIGNRVFDETGSPLAATAAEIAPDVIGSAIGLRGADAALDAAGKTAKNLPSAMTETAKSAVANINTAKEFSAPILRKAAEDIFSIQTPFKKRITEKLIEGSTDIDVARFKLTSSGKSIKDKVATESINQGFDEGVISAVKAASRADKDVMLKMVDIMEKGKNNARFASQNRPSDIAGDTLMERFKSVKGANLAAGRELNEIAKGLKGQNIDINQPAINFAQSLDELGVTLSRAKDGGFKPDFTRSQLAPGDRGPILEVIRQMNIRGDGGIDAFDVHKMKKVIDNNVTFGKTNKGISGDAERALKSFRRDLDQSLDSTFPDYDRVNSTYAETIGALDAFQDVAGRKMDLTGPNADKATGTLLRRIMSNAQSRVRLLDSINEIESVAAKYGASNLKRIEGAGLGKNDLLTQVLFVDELDSVFGSVARTSFQGQIDQALKQGVNAATTQAGAVDLGLTAAGKLAEKARGINQEGAFKSIKELLKQAEQ
jgi:hypothetical protein